MPAEPLPSLFFSCFFLLAPQAKILHFPYTLPRFPFDFGKVLDTNSTQQSAKITDDTLFCGKKRPSAPPHFWMSNFLKSRYQSKTRFLKSAKWPLSPGSLVGILSRKLVFRGDTATFERPCESPKVPLKCRHLSYGFLCFFMKNRKF